MSWGEPKHPAVEDLVRLRDQNRELILHNRALRAAISDHRRAIGPDGHIHRAADLELWSVLHDGSPLPA